SNRRRSFHRPELDHRIASQPHAVGFGDIALHLGEALVAGDGGNLRCRAFGAPKLQDRKFQIRPPAYENRREMARIRGNCLWRSAMRANRAGTWPLNSATL